MRARTAAVAAGLLLITGCSSGGDTGGTRPAGGTGTATSPTPGRVVATPQTLPPSLGSHLETPTPSP
ncbi:MAG: hypothetical protein ACXVWU_11255 [Nocardioides sp.]